jgi:HD-like signal output (HDOD) protein
LPTAWEIISQNTRLVTLPDVYLRLKAVLDDPDSTLADVTVVVEKDPALTVKLLRMVNSAYFGLESDIDTVSRAIGLLGTQEVHDLVLATSVAQSFEGMSNEIMDMQKFWRRSVVCAITARELASLCNLVQSERLFVIGLLRDIGHLFIYQLAPNEARQSISLSREQNIPVYKMERRLLGVDHSKIGAHLMHQWQLPQSLWEPTEFQYEPEKSKAYKLFTNLVHIAAHLTEETEHNLGVEEALARISRHAWQVPGLTREICTKISDRVDLQVAAVMRLMFPSLNTSAA